MLRRLQRGQEDEPQLGTETAEEDRDALAADQLDDLLVEEDVERRDFLPLLGLQRSLGFDYDALDRVQRLARSGSAVADRHDLERLARPVEVADFGRGELADGDAAVDGGADEALVAEQPQRLARRVARDVERLRQRVLAQRRARGSSPRMIESRSVSLTSDAALRRSKRRSAVSVPGSIAAVPAASPWGGGSCLSSIKRSPRGRGAAPKRLHTHGHDVIIPPVSCSTILKDEHPVSLDRSDTFWKPVLRGT